MTESTSPQGQQPLTIVQTRQLHRSLTEKILERAESDPEWKQQLIDDPELAMREANFPEAQKLQQSRQPEVRGHGYHFGYLSGHGWQWGINDNEYDCVTSTWYWKQPCLGGFTQIH